MKQEVGIVTISYLKDGRVESANFVPTMNIKADKNVINNLKKVENSADTESLVHNAQSVFALWFNKANEIEEADRFEYEIASETIECEKYEDGKVKKCVIKFTYQTINTNN